jgi:hypothetical protein
MRVRRTHHDGIGLSFNRNVVAVSATSTQQPQILAARHRIPDLPVSPSPDHASALYFPFVM